MLESTARFKQDLNEIIVRSDEKAIHISYNSSGVLVEEKYFPLSLKKIYISNTYSNENSVNIYESSDVKSLFFAVQDSNVFVFKPTGFNFYLENDFEFDEITIDKVNLLKNKKLQLRRGNAQITISLKDMPPALVSLPFFSLEKPLVSLICSSVFFAFLLFFFISYFVDVPVINPVKEVKKEFVVIYKKPIKPEVPVAQESPVELNNAPEPKIIPQEVVATPPKPSVPLPPAVPIKPLKAVMNKNVIASEVPKPAYKPQVQPLDIPTEKKISFKGINVNKYSKNELEDPDVFKDHNSTDTAQSKTAFGLGNAQTTTTTVDSSHIGQATNTFAIGDHQRSPSTLGTGGLSNKSNSDTAYSKGKRDTKEIDAIDPNLIIKIMREYIPQFRYCYQKELVSSSNAAGAFDLLFKINQDGKGFNVNLKSDSYKFSAVATDCISKVVSIIPFPQPRGGAIVDVIQPLNFVSENQRRDSL